MEKLIADNIGNKLRITLVNGHTPTGIIIDVDPLVVTMEIGKQIIYIQIDKICSVYVDK